MPQYLTERAIKIIWFNEDLKFAIAKATGRTFKTVERWLRENNELLTIASSLKLIKEHTGLTDTEILEDDKITA